MKHVQTVTDCDTERSHLPAAWAVGRAGPSDVKALTWVAVTVASSEGYLAAATADPTGLWAATTVAVWAATMAGEKADSSVC